MIYGCQLSRWASGFPAEKQNNLYVSFWMPIVNDTMLIQLMHLRGKYWKLMADFLKINTEKQLSSGEASVFWILRWSVSSVECFESVV